MTIIHMKIKIGPNGSLKIEHSITYYLLGHIWLSIYALQGSNSPSECSFEQTEMRRRKNFHEIEIACIILILVWNTEDYSFPYGLCNKNKKEFMNVHSLI